VVGAAAVLLLAALSARVFRSRSTALATGVLAAVHPSFLLICDDIQSEPLFLLCVLGAGWLLLAAVDRPSSNLAVAAGVSLGLAALTRSTALAFGIFLAAPLANRRYPPRVRAHLAAAALLGFALALAPWTLRNYRRFHEWLPVNDAGGLSLYHGNSVWTRSFYKIRSREEYVRWVGDLDRDMRRRLAAIEIHGPLSPGQRSRAFARMAIAESRADPGGTLRMFAEKAWQWSRPYPTPWFWPMPVVAVIGVYYTALYVLAAFGLARAARRGVAWFAAATLVASMAIHVLFLVVWRYRIPYWDPVLLLYAAAGGARIVDATRAPNFA
jgi:4-amino-4-deoxy-L-arabinose transferase-like glycosyltransferase